jgi:hypothetical protein
MVLGSFTSSIQDLIFATLAAAYIGASIMTLVSTLLPECSLCDEDRLNIQVLHAPQR